MLAMATGATFVHDFVGVDLPLAMVVNTLDHSLREDLIDRLVTEAWLTEVRALDAAGSRTGQRPRPRLDVLIGPPRVRADATVVPVSWRSLDDTEVPPLDADLEFAMFGPNRTHLHLYGSSAVPPLVEPSSQEASLRRRLGVAVVRRVLTMLRDLIVLESAADRLAAPIPRR